MRKEREERKERVDTSLLSSLSDCLRDYCVLVTKLSLSSSSSVLPLDLARTRSPFLTRLSSLTRISEVAMDYLLKTVLPVLGVNHAVSSVYHVLDYIPV
jgi:hypothetical protein